MKRDSKRESSIESQAKTELAKLGALAIKIESIAGYPDRLVTWTNKHGVPLFFNIEFKAKTGQLSKIQKFRIDQVPGTTYVCRSVAEAIKAFNTEKEKYNDIT